MKSDFKAGDDTNSVISELRKNGYELNFMPINGFSTKALFYAKKHNEWFEFLSTINDYTYGLIIYIADYNYMLDQCEYNLIRLEKRYIGEWFDLDSNDIELLLSNNLETMFSKKYKTGGTHRKN